MASAIEALGMTLPGSSSFPAESTEKHDECASIGPVMHNLLAKNILPRQIMTRSAFENALVLTMILGGSTNAVLHLIAIAHSVGIKLGIDDVQNVSDRIPFLADIKPSGKYVMEDIYKLGGIPKILAFLLENKLIDGNNLTITGRTLGENLEEWTHKYGALEFRNQDIIRPLDNPIKSTGHIRILKGNLAPGGAVAKITGKEGLGFVGKARAFDSEDDFVKATQGRTGSHGFCIGHVVPEAQEGGPIALVKDGDIIAVDAVKNTIELRVPEEELERRRAEWKAPPLKVTQGTLYKYTKVVTDASHGCVTDA
ncbi:hypothetical protein NLJ89_g8687 [Agrocybe chaxingu]|uniref:Dihydroxy-acid dehydratase n=1 Tax=Agrocybe chaxingu TaxID=84603 RepID=A0A9W8JTZ2_9AGAR|nr:hypothetical protein NLJ89_g8687 [Agrocybe chaxingu]